MKVKIKRLHEDAVIPVYAKDGDCGLDLTATSISTDKQGNTVYGTGLAFEIPRGFVGLLFPRSSNSKVDLLLTNSVGVLDSGYRGEVMFKYGSYRANTTKEVKVTQDTVRIVPSSLVHQVGDRIGQIVIMPYPTIEFEEAEELTETERGSGGYGSTGK